MSSSDPAKVTEADRQAFADWCAAERIKPECIGLAEKLWGVRRERAARREGAEAGLREALEQIRAVTGQVTFPLEERGRRAYRIATDALARPVEPDRATESERDRLVRERDAARDGLEWVRDMGSEVPFHVLNRGQLEGMINELRNRARAALAQSGGGGGKS